MGSKPNMPTSGNKMRMLMPAQPMPAARVHKPVASKPSGGHHPASNLGKYLHPSKRKG